MGTRSFLDAHGPGKSFEKDVLGRSSFPIMFKTELSGKQQRVEEVEGLHPSLSAPIRPPWVGASGSEPGSASPGQTTVILGLRRRGHEAQPPYPRPR